MIKKLIWTAVFVSMALVGSLAAFGISDVWTSLRSWWDESLSPLWDENANGAAEWFAFIGGTIWTMILVAPVWYLWKGTGIFLRGKVIGLILRALLIVVIYLLPTIMGIVVGTVDSLSIEDAWYQAFEISMTWIIIGLALLGLWFKS